MPYNITVLNHDNIHLRHIILEEDEHDGLVTITQHIAGIDIVYQIIRIVEETHSYHGRVRTPLYDSFTHDDYSKLEQIKSQLRLSYFTSISKMPIQPYMPISTRFQYYREWFNKTIAEIVKVGAKQYADNLNNNINEFKGI